MSLLTLPNELIEKIYSELDYDDFLKLPKTSKDLYNALGSYRYQKLLEEKSDDYVNDIIDKLDSQEFMALYFFKYEFLKADDNRLEFLNQIDLPNSHVYIFKLLSPINIYKYGTFQSFNEVYVSDLENERKLKNYDYNPIDVSKLKTLLKTIIRTNLSLYIINKESRDYPIEYYYRYYLLLEK